MKARSDTERILDAYLAPEADRLADRVIDAALADIARTPQRRALRVPWRLTLMPALSRATAVAVVAIVAVVGAGTLAYLNSDPSNAGSPGTPSPTATPTPSPTTGPTAAGIPPLPEGTLAAGTYRLRPFTSETMTIDVTVPDGGWQGAGVLAGPVGDANGPNGVAIAFLKAQTINSDPCHWDKDGSARAPQEGDIEVGPTVDDLAAALAGSSVYESTTPVDATLGGFSGKRLELQLAPDAAGCDSYDGAGNQYFVFGGRDGSFYAQGDANTWQVTIVDVDGTRLIAVLVSYEETSAADLSAAQGILESAVITP
jgi:hypothetical protein